MFDSGRMYITQPSPDLLEQRMVAVPFEIELDPFGLVQVPDDFATDMLHLLPGWAAHLRQLTQVPTVAGGILILKDERLVVGTIGFKNDPKQTKEVEIGYGINASHWGLGLATEAVAAMVAWTFESGYAARVTAKTAVSNIASQRVLEKNSFIKTGETEFDPDDGELIFWALERKGEV